MHTHAHAMPKRWPWEGALSTGAIVTSGVRSGLAGVGRGYPEIRLPRWA